MLRIADVSLYRSSQLQPIMFRYRDLAWRWSAKDMATFGDFKGLFKSASENETIVKH
jgi:hypothetical protein